MQVSRVAELAESTQLVWPSAVIARRGSWRPGHQGPQTSRRSWSRRRPRLGLVAQLAPGRRARRSNRDSNDLDALGPSFSHEYDCATGWADPTNCLV